MKNLTISYDFFFVAVMCYFVLEGCIAEEIFLHSTPATGCLHLTSSSLRRIPPSLLVAGSHAVMAVAHWPWPWRWTGNRSARGGVQGSERGFWKGSCARARQQDPVAALETRPSE